MAAHGSAVQPYSLELLDVETFVLFQLRQVGSYSRKIQKVIVFLDFSPNIFPSNVILLLEYARTRQVCLKKVELANSPSIRSGANNSEIQNARAPLCE